MPTNHTIILGDSREMKRISDESIHLIITSPPYWQLKDYGTEDQIGFHDSYESYINNLNIVWLECYRVLYPGCRLCINIGDQFARSVYYGRYKVIPIRTEIIRFCETVGLDYMGAIIWQKVTTTNTSGGATIMGSFPYPRNGILKLNYEFILIFKKKGNSPRPTPNNRGASKLTIEEWNTYFSGHWTFPGTRQTGHQARFPQELPKRLIRMFSFVGDTVLDPFLGSGTTAGVAAGLGRNSIGYEINDSFESMIRFCISPDGKQLDFLEEPNHEIDVTVIRDTDTIDIDAKLHQLPYIFHDPISLSISHTCGNRSSGGSSNTPNRTIQKTFRVIRIVSPASVELEDAGVVTLAGIRERPNLRVEALDYLKSRILGKHILVKWDSAPTDSTQSAYILLKNRTNVNAHLIKNGLVDVDTESTFRMKARFVRYAKDASDRTDTSD